MTQLGGLVRHPRDPSCPPPPWAPVGTSLHVLGQGRLWALGVGSQDGASSLSSWAVEDPRYSFGGLWHTVHGSGGGSASGQPLQAEEGLWPLSFCEDNNCAGLLEGVEGEKLPKKGSVAAWPPLLGDLQKAGNMGDSSCQE